VHIQDILKAVELGETPVIPENWVQGRTIYGGLSAAIMLQAAQQGVDPERKLRAVDVNFTRPFEAQMPYEIHTETLGEGKTVCVRNVRIIQQGKVRGNLRADFCRPLENPVVIDKFQVPNIRPQAKCLPMQGPLLPTFFCHMEAYLASKAPPFAGSDVAEMHGWMRYKEAPKHSSAPLLVGLIDAWPPTASTHYTRPVPMSTISWHMHFTLDADNFGPQDFLGYHSVADFDEAGISSSTAWIWRPDGRLLAKSVQTNIIYG
jgi:acyl-CoA thioesterase